MTVFKILICCSRKGGVLAVFTFAIKALTNTSVPARLAHFTQSASIFRNRKAQRSFIQDRGKFIVHCGSCLNILFGQIPQIIWMNINVYQTDNMKRHGCDNQLTMFMND